MDFPINDNTDQKEAVLALTLQAAQYPLMRRVNQQFIVEDKLRAYEDEITRLSILNKSALASIKNQEHRLKEIQSFLRRSKAPQQHQQQQNIDRNWEMKVPNQEKMAFSTDNEVSITTEFNQDSHEQHPTAPIITDASDQSTSTGHKETSTQVCGSMEETHNVIVAEVSNNSFTLKWDVGNDRHSLDNIYDVEIRYSHTASGVDTSVHQRSCSRWVLKDPVPKHGKLVVDQLETDTEYRDVCLRFRSRLGWSEFTKPIKKICTSESGELIGGVSPVNAKIRRGQFLYRIEYIKQTIQRLTEERSTIPAKQMKLAHIMKKVHDRMIELASESERVLAIDDNNSIISSPLLHGSRQAFTKSELERQLQNECVKCQNQIAQCRAEIIRLDRQRDDLNTNISNEVIKLNDRKARLSKLDQQIDTVHGLKRIISQQSGDALRRYFSWWRAKTTSALDAKKTITSLAQYCRRQMLRKAWLKLQLQKRTVCSSFAHAGGIGQRLIETAEACIENDHNEASCLAHDLNLAATTNELPMNVGNHDFLDDLMSNEDLTAYLPCKDDIACLEKGAFYFRSARYSSSLKCLELVVSKMRSLRYFEGIHNVHATTIQSAVWGKLAQVHLMLEKYDTAIVYYNRQRFLANEINLQEPQFNAMIGLGRCYIAKSDVEYAHSLFQEALSGISQIGKAIDTRQLALVFTWLEKSLTQMNRLNEAAGFAAKLNEMRDRRKEQVQAAIDEMGVMQQRMIDINARKSRAVLLETASANLVLFKRERAKKQRLISQYTENLSKTTERIEKLLDLESQLKLEIQEASTTKKKRLVSRLINGMSQEIKTSELIHRLKDQLGVVEGKRNEAVAESDRIGLLIHNTQDEIARIDDSIAIENGPLMQRVLKKRNYRCMALNASNSARNDVAGTSKGCIELVASTEGKELYLHNITTGKLEFAFTGDQEGRHIGEVYGHTSTISALRFHGDKVYTGGMDHCVIGWCVRSMKKLFVARGHEATVTCLWTNSSELVSGSADTTIILWKKDDGSLLRRIHGHARGVHHIISSSIPSSSLNMVSASYGTLFCWRRDATSTPICHRRLQLPQGDVTALQYGELEVITGDSMGYISVFWVETGEILKSISAHQGPVASLQVDATKAVTCGLDMIVQVVDMIRGTIIQSLRGHSHPIVDVVFDTSRILSLSTDGEIRSWDWINRRHSERKKLQFGNDDIVR